MAEPYSVEVMVPSGDPGGTKEVTMPFWTGLCVAIPREHWVTEQGRPEMSSSGIYILTGSLEEEDQDLPGVYIGQADNVRKRMSSHLTNKDFWDWCYVFTSPGAPLGRNSMSWLESNLYKLAKDAGKSILDNGNTPPVATGLTRAEEAAAKAFMSRMLIILSLLGVTAFQLGSDGGGVVVSRGSNHETSSKSPFDADTIVVPARDEGFNEVFLGENAWYAIRISGGRIPNIKYIAAYRVDPISAVTHYAEVDRIERLSNEGKYKVVFKGPAVEIPPVVAEDRNRFKPQGPRYTRLEKLLSVSRLDDLWG